METISPSHLPPISRAQWEQAQSDWILKELAQPTHQPSRIGGIFERLYNEMIEREGEQANADTYPTAAPALNVDQNPN